MNKSNEIYKIINQMSLQKDLLIQQEKLGIMDADGVRKELEIMTQKERKLREVLVLENHVSVNGEPRAISYHEPTPNNPKAFYGTKMADGKKLKATTYEGLIDKLYDFYTNGLSDFSIRSVFEAALLEKAVTENPKQNTLTKNRADFKRFINETLASKDIRTVTDIEIKKYTQEWVNEVHPKQKVFLSYKGVLNLVFGYAFSHRIISKNPVDSMKNKPYMKSCDTRKAKPEEKILSPEEIESLKQEVRYRMTKKKWGAYYINGYAMLFAIETGVRAGELCAIKWEDVNETSIHIHAQQLTRMVDGKTEYYYDPSTKNEKGISQDGREFPLTKKIRLLLQELKDLQQSMNIQSEFIFCHEDGEWIKTDAYETFLRRLCQSKDLSVTNNHALRMSLNSNVLIPMGITVADRAAMLGHSIQTNLQFYSFAQKGYLENVRAILDGDSIPEDNDSRVDNQGFSQGTLGNPSNVLDFPKRKASNY